MTRAEQIIPLAEAFPAVQAWLDDGPGSAVTPPRTAACDIAEAFGLDLFGRNILLLCAYATLEPEGRAELAALLGDPQASAPTVGLALACLPGAHWQALAADAPLRRRTLIRIEGAGALVDGRMHLPETVLFRLIGAPGIASEAAPLLRALDRPGDLAPNRSALAREIARRMALVPDAVLHLTGGDPEGKLQAFAAASAMQGATAHAVSSDLLPQTPGDLVRLAETLHRDMVLQNGRLILVLDDPAEPRLARLFAECYPGPLAVAAPEPLRVGHRMAFRLDMAPLATSDQLAVWQAALGDLTGQLGDSLPRLSASFRVTPETARAVAAELTLDAGASDLAQRAWNACRRAARPRMDDLAQRVESPAGWDDLILPKRQKQVLAAIVAQVRNRARVYEDWGFGPRLQMKGLGVSALFSGPSGAGKSMAGEVIGNALALDVYRVDLSAIVSKWVGETEKNLRRVFDAAEDGGVILQFDEADALFGRRSEVKDSHDRHANIEVSYLLQRLEQYRGLCILTTNMRDNIDEAFLRRLRFMVDFRFPSVAERRAIWKRIFPEATPLDDLDYERLAELNVTGGAIRNIALSASFLAADRTRVVGMGEILEAARLEYDKTGRVMTDAERAGWPT